MPCKGTVGGTRNRAKFTVKAGRATKVRVPLKQASQGGT